MKCDFCKKKISLSFTFCCNLCNLNFCCKHRMYESHKCANYKKEKIELKGTKSVKIIKI